MEGSQQRREAARVARLRFLLCLPSGHSFGRSTETDLLAKFAVQGTAEEALVEKLLGDTLLMRDLLVAGGAQSAHYGEAMAIYSKLLTASSALRDAVAAAPASLWDDRSPANVLKRLAVAVAVAHAVPINIRFQNAVMLTVDPVKRYTHFEKAYAAGDLDPAFASLTTFELSHTVDADSVDEDMTWLRRTMANFRPDNIAMDYHWRCENDPANPTRCVTCHREKWGLFERSY